MDSAIVQRIYEAAFLPDGWPGVLDAIIAHVEARGSIMFVANPQRSLMRLTASTEIRPLAEEYAAAGWPQRDGKLERILKSGRAGFVADHEIYSQEELKVSEAHNLFMRPRGLGDGAGIALALPTGDIVGLGVIYDLQRGPTQRKFVRRLDALRPHLARASLMAARLGMERAKVAGQMLETLGLPALIFDAAGRVAAPNALIENCTSHVQWRAGHRFALRDQIADEQFRAACAAIGGDKGASVRSFAVAGAEGAPLMVAHVVPIRGNARDLFARSVGALILTPATLPQAPAAELLQSLFDLTPAEARVARAMAVGESIETIAASARVSVNTVRTQVRALLAKTGRRRQGEIVALLAGLKVGRDRASDAG
ncbi:MAG: helix-turn-helix transcriptional regulator [Rhodoblastus sp.]|nr:helix-turn-helix transcriptional regulator [Rhodoblastus sp.]